MSEQLFNIEYLEKAASLFNEIKEASYKPFGSIVEGHLADIGCGTGHDVIGLADRLPGSVRITGVDADPQMIRKANAQPGPKDRVDFVLGDVKRLPFDNGTLSGVRNERLIQHVEGTEQAFGEFHRVLRAGAPLVTVETDWSSLCLYNAPAGLAHKIRAYYTFNNVANGAAALQLSAYLRANGFRQIRLQVFPVISRLLEEVRAFARLDYVLQDMVEKHYISISEHNELRESMEFGAANQHFVTTVNIIMATAIK